MFLPRRGGGRPLGVAPLTDLAASDTPDEDDAPDAPEGPLCIALGPEIEGRIDRALAASAAAQGASHSLP